MLAAVLELDRINTFAAGAILREVSLRVGRRVDLSGRRQRRRQDHDDRPAYGALASALRTVALREPTSRACRRISGALLGIGSRPRLRESSRICRGGELRDHRVDRAAPGQRAPAGAMSAVFSVFPEVKGS